MFSCEIGNAGKICLWNPESWTLESGIQLGILLRIGIQNPSSTDKDWNQVTGIQNSRLSWLALTWGLTERQDQGSLRSND